MTVVKVKEVKTGAIKIAIYAPNKKGNKRYNIDNVFLKDKEFDKNYKIITE